MGGRGSGAKKGQRRRTNAQIAADRAADRASEGEAREARDARFWGRNTATARPSTGNSNNAADDDNEGNEHTDTNNADDDHTDDENAGNSNCRSSQNNSRNGEHEVHNNAAAADTAPPPHPLPTPPIYSEGDVLFCFRGESTDEAKVIGVDKNENRPVYEVELADGSSHSSSWEETVLKPNGWRAIVYNRHLNRESAAFTSVWKDHEAFVRSVMETDAVGDDGSDTDAEPTEDDPLPGVDLSMVPKILRKRIGEAAAEVRHWCNCSYQQRDYWIRSRR